MRSDEDWNALLSIVSRLNVVLGMHLMYPGTVVEAPTNKERLKEISEALDKLKTLPLDTGGEGCTSRRNASS